MRILSIILIFLLLGSICEVSYSAENSLATAETYLKAQQYTEYVKTLADCEFSNATIKFSTVVALAISLEKSKMWDSEIYNQFKAKLDYVSYAPRNLLSLRKALDGDISGLVDIFKNQDAYPKPNEIKSAAAILKEHGYDGVGNALTVLGSYQVNEQIAAWLLLQDKDRKIIDSIMQSRYSSNSKARDEFVYVAIEMAKNNMKVQANQDDLINFAIWFGSDANLVNITTAYSRLHFGQRDIAIAIANNLGKYYIDNPDKLIDIANFFNDAGDQKSACQQFEQALTKSHDPFARDLRLQYYSFLMLSESRHIVIPDVASLSDIISGKNILNAGDALLVSGKPLEAMEKYQLVIKDNNASIDNRLAAWGGILYIDPTQTALYNQEILDTVAKQELQSRQSYVAWMGKQVDSVVSRMLPPKFGSVVRNKLNTAGLPIPQKEWSSELSSIMSQLYKIDKRAILLTPGIDANKLRLTRGILFAIDGKYEEAIAVVEEEITYEMPAPQGGWIPVRDNVALADINKPRTITNPNFMEKEYLLNELLDSINRYYSVMTDKKEENKQSIVKFAAVIMKDNAETLKNEKKQEIISIKMQYMAKELLMLIKTIDPLPKPLRTDIPPPPFKEVDMTLVKPLLDDVSQSLNNPLVAREGLSLISRNGLKDAMMTASNPELQDELFSLIMQIVNRYMEVTNDQEGTAQIIDFLAVTYSRRPVFDMQKYISQLRNKLNEVKGIDK